MIQEDKSSRGECFKQLYTGFLYLRSLLWLGPLPPPSSSQLLPHIMCHTTVDHSLPKHLVLLVSSHTSLHREFLLQKALAVPRGSFSSELSKNTQVNQSQMLLFPS